MKVGGNESATKFFRSNGGSAALVSKDAKTKYQSPAATKYKEELKKRAARDAVECVRVSSSCRGIADMSGLSGTLMRSLSRMMRATVLGT